MPLNARLIGLILYNYNYTTIIITVHEKHNSSVNNYYSACMKNKTTVKDNESLYLWIIIIQLGQNDSLSGGTTKMIYHDMICMHHFIVGVRAETRAV